LKIMTIEVKQMLIKSNVLQKNAAEEKGSGPCEDLETMKEDILSKCRQLFIELLREEQER
jgi:hypothetical protein